MAAVRRVSANDSNVWELTGRAIALIAGALTIGAFLISVTAAGVVAHQQLQGATPTTRHDSLRTVVARHDSDIAEVRSELAEVKQRLLGLNCQQDGYPTPFCDDVPRVLQAGQPRSRR